MLRTGGACGHRSVPQSADRAPGKHSTLQDTGAPKLILYKSPEVLVCLDNHHLRAGAFAAVEPIDPGLAADRTHSAAR